MYHKQVDAALKSMLQIYFSNARSSGRTSAMINSLKDGDVVIFADDREARRVKRLAAQRGIHIATSTARLDRPEYYADKIKGGRVVFDHEVIEAFYLREINHCTAFLDRLLEELSGRPPESCEDKIYIAAKKEVFK